MMGKELASARKNLGLSLRGLSAIIHLFGGRAPAKATMVRREKAKAVPHDTAALVNILLETLIVPDEGKREPIPSWSEYVVARRNDTSPINAVQEQPLRADYERLVLNQIRAKVALPLDILDGFREEAALRRLALHRPDLVAKHLVKSGYGYAEDTRRRPNRTPERDEEGLD